MDRNEERLPPRSIVERKLEDLLADRITPEEAAKLARPYALGEIAERTDPTDIPSWEALTSLGRCDVKEPDDGGYLYNKVSFRSWLEKLRTAPLKPTGT